MSALNGDDGSRQHGESQPADDNHWLNEHYCYGDERLQVLNMRDSMLGRRITNGAPSLSRAGSRNEPLSRAHLITCAKG